MWILFLNDSGSPLVSASRFRSSFRSLCRLKVGLSSQDINYKSRKFPLTFKEDLVKPEYYITLIGGWGEKGGGEEGERGGAVGREEGRGRGPSYSQKASSGFQISVYM